VTNQVQYLALAIAEYGWPVFPCRPGQKTPATRHGYLDATTDLDQVDQWFSRPGMNLAVATGTPGPDVLDIDHRGPAASGFPALERLRAGGLLDGATGQVRTPGAGLHVYFEGTSQRTAHLPASHLDFLAVGGYVLIPPSQVNGRPYEPDGTFTVTARGGHLNWQAAARLLEPPSRQREQPSPHRRPGEQLDALARWVANQPAGNRNAGLFWAANRALEADQAADLSPLAAAARQAGLPDAEITRTLRSARSTTTQARREPPGRQAEGG
jgi:hypothetical protein